MGCVVVGVVSDGFKAGCNVRDNSCTIVVAIIGVSIVCCVGISVIGSVSSIGAIICTGSSCIEGEIFELEIFLCACSCAPIVL